MKVLHLRTGRKHDVWAMCDDDGRCQVMEELKKVYVEHPDLVEKITVLLYEVVPNEGPPIYDRHRARMLYRDVVYELKADKHLSGRRRIGLRIAFFFDNSVVICTNAFTKAERTPDSALKAALDERTRYYEERSNLEFQLPEWGIN